ncbi:MAG: hypothetical protein ABI877_04120 [Gemmatimonadaceae bacterium]
MLTVATSVHAQERGRGGGGRDGRSRGQAAAPKDPTYWASLGTGFLRLAPVENGNTQALWDFGEGFPLTFSLERVVASGISAGIGGSYLRAPLRYDGPTSLGGCGRCDAHATVATYGAVIHSGGSGSQTGLYQVFRLFVGVMQFGAFEQDSPRRTLAPESANKDFLFTAGYGFGYGIARDWRVELTADYMNSIHERDNLPGNAQTLSRHFLIGLGLRVGF